MGLYLKRNFRHKPERLNVEVDDLIPLSELCEKHDIKNLEPSGAKFWHWTHKNKGDERLDVVRVSGVWMTTEDELLRFLKVLNAKKRANITKMVQARISANKGRTVI